MKNILSLFCVLASVAACAAEATISDVVVRQRLPWNAKVDIDFTVCGTNCDIEAMAQYDGVEPFSLVTAGGLSGDVIDVAPGAGHLTWDPAKAGLDGTTLKNFTVTLSPAAAHARDYLILDLQTGACSYRAEPPEDGWIDAEDGAYYLTKMVFRRVPKGTFQMGLSEDQREFLLSLCESTITSANSAHSVTLSHDYYVAVFKTTVGQMLCATGTVAKTLVKVPTAGTANRTVAKATYNALRGSVADGINWPSTEGGPYKVKSGCIIDDFRTLVGANLPEEWAIDLPTAAQWERMAKSGAPDDWFVFNYGDPPYSAAAMTNALNQSESWAAHYKSSGTSCVGWWSPTTWGFYDVCGLNYEWNLDWVPSSKLPDAVDPVGISKSGGGSDYRYRRSWTTSVAGKGMTIPYLMPGMTGTYGPENKNPSFRLCIHTHRLSK